MYFRYNATSGCVGDKVVEPDDIGNLNACVGIFTARRYASAVLAVNVCPSVRPSVCHKSELYKDG